MGERSRYIGKEPDIHGNVVGGGPGTYGNVGEGTRTYENMDGEDQVHTCMGTWVEGTRYICEHG